MSRGKVLSAAAAYLGLVVAASWSPVPALWGLGAPGEYGRWAVALFFILAALAATPTADRVLGRLLARWTRLPRGAVFSGGTCLALALAWAGRVRLPWLGDQLLWLRTLSFQPRAGHLLEPLSFASARAAKGWLPPDPHGIVGGPALLSVALLVPFLLFTWLLAGELTGDPRRRLWSWIFLSAVPQSLLFHGYVESYGLLLVALTALAWVGLRAMHEVSPWPVWGAFAVALGAHLQAIAVLPAAWVATRRRRWVGPGLAVGLLIAGAAVAWYLIAGAHFPGQEKTAASTLAFLREAGREGNRFGGRRHLLGVVDVLLANGGPLLLLLPVLAGNRSTETEPRRALFLLLLVVPGVAGVVLVRLSLGAIRDWDLFSAFLYFLYPLTALLWLRRGATRQLPRLSALVLVLSVLHAAAWVHVDADRGRGLTRAERLCDADLFSPTARASTADEFAFLAREAGDHAGAAAWYARAARAAPGNWRFFNNLGTELRRLGKTAEAETAFATAVSQRPTVADPYVGLGGLRLSRRDLPGARAAFTRGLARAGYEPRLLFGRAAALAMLDDLDGAAGALDTLLRRTPERPEYRRLAGRVAGEQGRYAEAIKQLEVFLRARPEDTEAWRLTARYATALGDSARAREAARHLHGRGRP